MVYSSHCLQRVVLARFLGSAQRRCNHFNFVQNFVLEIARVRASVCAACWRLSASACASAYVRVCACARVCADTCACTWYVWLLLVYSCSRSWLRFVACVFFPVIHNWLLAWFGSLGFLYTPGVSACVSYLFCHRCVCNLFMCVDPSSLHAQANQCPDARLLFHGSGVVRVLILAGPHPITPSI